MSIYNLNPALESPPYGEALEAGELFLDGTDSFVSSDGRKPVVDVVDFFKSKYVIDGVETDEARSKWPGYRGAYGFFGEYENLAIESSWVLSNATLLDEGDWKKMSTVSPGTEPRVNVAMNTGVTEAYVSVELRKGEYDTATETKVFILPQTAIYTATVDWTLKTISFDGGMVDGGSIFISDEIVIVRAYATFVASTGTPTFRIRNSGLTTESIAGDYAYFRNWMAIEGMSYPVPYHPSTHPAAKLQYNKDWSQSTEWTIQGWLKTDADFSTNRRFMDTRANVGEDDGIGLLTEVTTGELVVFTKADGTGVNIIGDPITIGAWEHLKFIFTSETQIDLYQNGILTGSGVASIPSVANIRKSLYLGYQESNGARSEGYLADWTIQPGIDTTTTHYTSGLPYYDPDKTMGQDASWSIDKRGNISGIPQQAGVIIEDYELDGQSVTKWDSGLMQITLEETQTIDVIYAADDDFYGTSVVTPTVEEFVSTYYSNYVTDSLSYRANPTTASSLTLFKYFLIRGVSVSGATKKVVGITIGRWK